MSIISFWRETRFAARNVSRVQRGILCFQSLSPEILQGYRLSGHVAGVSRQRLIRTSLLTYLCVLTTSVLNAGPICGNGGAFVNMSCKHQITKNNKDQVLSVKFYLKDPFNKQGELYVLSKKPSGEEVVETFESTISQIPPSFLPVVLEWGDYSMRLENRWTHIERSLCPSVYKTTGVLMDGSGVELFDCEVNTWN